MCSDGTNTCEQPDVVCQDETRTMVYATPGASVNNGWIVFIGGEVGSCSGSRC